MVCDKSNDLKIEIADPCTMTVPGTQSIPYLSAARLDIDGEFVNWQFPDSVDDATKFYGIGKCGPMQLEIFDGNR